jgi:hypothetical protein
VAIRFFIDVETGLPHIYEHNVSEDEVRDVLRNPFQEFRGRRNSIVAFGQARGGRFLKVIYSRDDDGLGIFVITAYDLTGSQLHALRRRLRRRPT